jgi:hypothetical protein
MREPKGGKRRNEAVAQTGRVFFIGFIAEEIFRETSERKKMRPEIGISVLELFKRESMFQGERARLLSDEFEDIGPASERSSYIADDAANIGSFPAEDANRENILHPFSGKERNGTYEDRPAAKREFLSRTRYGMRSSSSDPNGGDSRRQLEANPEKRRKHSLDTGPCIVRDVSFKNRFAGVVVGGTFLAEYERGLIKLRQGHHEIARPSCSSDQEDEQPLSR